jgi:hypothetical protein
MFHFIDIFTIGTMKGVIKVREDRDEEQEMVKWQYVLLFISSDANLNIS